MVEFYQVDIRCLSLAAVAIRELCPTPAQLADNAELLFAPFLEDTGIANDFVERIHAQVRCQCVRSAGNAANFTMVSNRSLVHTLKAHHCELGGVDPTSAAGKHVGHIGKSLADVLHTSTGKVGGNARQEYHNARIAVLCDLARNSSSDDGATEVKACDLAAFETQIRAEWIRISQNPDQTEYNGWLALHQSKVKRRRTGDLHPPIAQSSDGNVEGELRAAPKPWTGCFHASSKREHVLDPAEVARTTAQFRELSKEERTNLLVNDSDLRVSAPVPERNAQPRSICRRNLQGCAAEWRNVCRLHLLSRVEAYELDQITLLMQKYARAIGKERFCSRNEIICFRGHHPDGKTKFYKFFLLQDLRMNPEVQFFVPVFWGCYDSDGADGLWEFPQEGELHVGTPRMECLGRNVATVLNRSSDEVAKACLDLAGTWAIHNVQFRWSPGRNLRRLELLGLDPEFVPPRRQPANKNKKQDTSLLAEGDPFEAGLAAAEPSLAHAASLASGQAQIPDLDFSDASSESVLSGLRDDPVAASDIDIGGLGDLEYCEDLDGGRHDEPNVGDGVVENNPDEELGADLEALQDGIGIVFSPPSPSEGDPAPATPIPIVVPAPATPLALVESSDTDEAAGPVEPDRGPDDKDIHRERPAVVAARGSNEEVIRGRTFWWLRKAGEKKGLSIRCPRCGERKDIWYADSPLTGEMAVDRLIWWADHCQPNHRQWGGRLLKDAIPPVGS